MDVFAIKFFKILLPCASWNNKHEIPMNLHHRLFFHCTPIRLFIEWLMYSKESMDNVKEISATKRYV